MSKGRKSKQVSKDFLRGKRERILTLNDSQTDKLLKVATKKTEPLRIMTHLWVNMGLQSSKIPTLRWTDLIGRGGK